MFNYYDIHQLILDYYSGFLKKTDVEVSTPKVKAFDFNSVSRFRLSSHFTYPEINSIMQELYGESVNINGITVKEGWHQYVLRLFVSRENPYIERNILMPMVESKHTAESVKLFCEGLEQLTAQS